MSFELRSWSRRNFHARRIRYAVLALALALLSAGTLWAASALGGRSSTVLALIVWADLACAFLMVVVISRHLPSARREWRQRPTSTR